MFSKFWPSKSTNDKDEQITSIPDKISWQTVEDLGRIRAQLESTPTPLLALITFSLGVASSTGGALLYARYGRRIRNADWITPDLFAKKRWIRGIVTSVGDADNFRLFHTPSFGGWRWPFKFRRVPETNKELKDQTLHIRIAGVDAPEAAHFGKPEQPHAAESLEWLRQKILGKPVYCQLLRRDQYSRVVANVHLAPRLLPGALFLGKNLSLEMLRAGCVTTYEQAGAEYGPGGKEEYLRVEAEARAARRGMWAKRAKVETPAEYKRRHRSLSAESAGPSEIRTSKGVGGWFSRLRLRQ